MLLASSAIIASGSAFAQEQGHKAFEIENITKQKMIRDVMSDDPNAKVLKKEADRKAQEIAEEKFKRLDRLVYAQDLEPFFEFERAAKSLADVVLVDPLPEPIECNAYNIDTCNPEFVFELEFVPPEYQKPVMAVRSLQLLQDNIVHGKKNAFDAYRAALQDTYVALSKLRTEHWQYKKNLDAIALFTLIGGNPELGQQVLSQTSLSENHSLYLEGALAYSMRDFDVAYDKFARINFKNVPPSTAAQFAVVKSMLAARFNVDKARSFLNHARRLAPGTLSEEAALRRLVRMASDDGNLESFMRASKVYVTQFSDSFYFTDFIKNYAYSLVRMPRENESKMLGSLKDITSRLEENEQLAIMSYVARTSVSHGLFELVGWASENGKALAKKNGKLYVQMSLYHLASTIFDHTKRDTLDQDLEAINPRVLNLEDKNLLSLVTALYERLYNESMSEEDILLAFDQQQAFPGDNIAKQVMDEGNNFADKNRVVLKAEALIEKSNEILKGQNQ
ncbi:MAG: hypothetical protein AB8B49_03600 [Nitratireductor sp.]